MKVTRFLTYLCNDAGLLKETDCTNLETCMYHFDPTIHCDQCMLVCFKLPKVSGFLSTFVQVLPSASISYFVYELMKIVLKVE